METEGKKYRLAPGTQVREEDFGLLFYTMSGPRLYFLSCGRLLDTRFFTRGCTVREWMEQCVHGASGGRDRVPEVEKSLQDLTKKGVILEY